MIEGKVFLVGGGPGDPGLITLKGVSCLREADCVVYDHLVPAKLLEYVREGAERIYVGKEAGRHRPSQEEINALLVDRARHGQRVVRLKGGDPFVFGRGGEEGEALAQAGIRFEVVPGVSSAIAVPAYAGIPVTHRGVASSIAILTGHEDPDKDDSSIQWAKLATGVDTLVFLMGVANLPRIVERLIASGRPTDAPCAVIRWGTTGEQMTVTGTLGTIEDEVAKTALSAPAILIVGDVVSLRDRLNWFESKPLFSKRIIVTRARDQVSVFARHLEEAGASVIECPVIQLEPPEGWEICDRAIDRLSAFSWIVFTSPNGVRAFLGRLRHRGRDLRSLASAQIAVIGPETAQECHRSGLDPELVPGEYRAEGLVESLRPHVQPGTEVLIPRASEARDILPVSLEAFGARVTVAPVYRTVPSKEGADRARELLAQKAVDVVTFTSSSTVRNFMAIFDPGEREALLRGVTVAAIGPVTAETVAEYGLTASIVPPTYTIPALAAAIVEYYQRKDST